MFTAHAKLSVNHITIHGVELGKHETLEGALNNCLGFSAHLAKNFKRQPGAIGVLTVTDESGTEVTRTTIDLS